MKTKTKISEITQEDLDNLLTTALYGNNWVAVSFKDEDYYGTTMEKIGDYGTDICAKILLSGKSIELRDYNAEDEDDFHGRLPHCYDYTEDYMAYTITLEDIRKGLQKAINQGDYETKCALHLIYEPEQLDLEEADTLIQFIMFGQQIYG